MGMGKTSGLFSAELVRWKDVLESARWDVEVCERLMNMNSRENAVDKVRVYLKECWDSMGPSLLELVGGLSSEKDLGSSKGGNKVVDGVPNDVCDKGVSESVFIIDEEGHIVSEEGLGVSNGGVCKEKAPVAGGNQDREKLGKRVLPPRINEGVFFFSLLVVYSCLLLLLICNFLHLKYNSFMENVVTSV